MGRRVRRKAEMKLIRETELKMAPPPGTLTRDAFLEGMDRLRGETQLSTATSLSSSMWDDLARDLAFTGGTKK